MRRTIHDLSLTFYPPSPVNAVVQGLVVLSHVSMVLSVVGAAYLALSTRTMDHRAFQVLSHDRGGRFTD